MTKTVHSVKLQAYASVDLDRLSYSNGDVVYDNTNRTLRLMDGVSQGGAKVATQTWTNSLVSSFVTSSTLTTTLNAYATTASVSSGYVSNSNLTTTLTGYVTTSNLTTTLTGYVTTSNLTTALNSYATTASLSSYATTASLSSYATTASLSSYATSSAITAAIGTVVDIANMGTYLLYAAVGNNTYGDVPLLTEVINGRPLGDLNNSGDVTAADSLLMTKYTAGVLNPVTDASAITYIETVFFPQLLSNTVKYSRYLIIKTNLTATLSKYATNTNLALKANIANPTFTGTVTAPTAIIGGVNLKAFAIAMGAGLA